MTYASVDELLNAIYHVFGSGVVVEQWGSYFRPLETYQEPTTVVVARTEAPAVQQSMAWD